MSNPPSAPSFPPTPLGLSFSIVITDDDDDDDDDDDHLQKQREVKAVPFSQKFSKKQKQNHWREIQIQGLSVLVLGNINCIQWKGYFRAESQDKVNKAAVHIPFHGR
jgi:hypothetical protein